MTKIRKNYLLSGKNNWNQFSKNKNIMVALLHDQLRWMAKFFSGL